MFQTRFDYQLTCEDAFPPANRRIDIFDSFRDKLHAPHLAATFARKTQVRLIFQPAEEGGAGAVGSSKDESPADH